MAVISGVPGVLDTRQGYAGQPYPPELVEALERQKAARGRVRHPAEIRAENATREREREAERKAANPNPRQALRDAHSRRHAAAAQVERLAGLQRKAADLVAELEGREDEQLARLDAGNKAAAERLIAAIERGAAREALPLAPKTDAAQAARAAVSDRLRITEAALQQLVAQLAEAREALVEADRAVRVAAYSLSIDYAVGEAEAIEALAAALYRRRVELWGLSVALTTEARVLGPGAAQGIPPAVGRTIGAAGERQAIDPAWTAHLARLREDPEAELTD